MNKSQNLINQLTSFEEDPEKLQDMLSGRVAKENVLDPSISADQLINQSNNPLFVAPDEFATTELSDVETEAQKQAADNNIRRQFTQNTIQPDASDYEVQKANIAFPDGAGVVESGMQSQKQWDAERNNVNALATPQTEYEKLEAKLQELRDLEAAQNETATKYNFGAKAAAIIGDTLARYNTGGIQKNAKANIQYTGPKLQEMMSIIGEVKAPGTKDQRAELLAQYQQLLASNKQTKADTLAERRVKAYEDQVAASKMNKSGRNEAGFTPYQQYQTEQKEKENVRKLSESVTKSGIPRLMEGVGKLEETIGMSLEDAVARNSDDDSSNDVDLPGYGRLTSILPDQALIIGKGRDVRQQVAGIINPEISEQYGATQALGEVKRFEKQAGTGGLESTDTVIKGLLGIKKAAQADLKNIKAGYEPNIETKYQERGGLPTSQSTQNKEDKDVRSYADSYFKGDYEKAKAYLKHKGEL
jgi:hypothetical protein